MGALSSSLKKSFEKLFGGVEHQVLMLGLDAAGKTTILYKMKLGKVVETVPTIGWHIEELKFENIKLIVWDICYASSLRPLWRHYYQGTSAIIFVVDSTDTQRMEEVKTVVLSMMSEDALQNIPLLIFANKQDLPQAQSPEQITEYLGLDTMFDRQWHVQACCATNGEGLAEGFDWVTNIIKNASTSLNKS